MSVDSLHGPRWLGVVIAVSLALLTACTGASSTTLQTSDVPRIGYLQVSQLGEQLREEFRAGLRDLGYIEGRNIVVEWRNAEGRADRLPALAAELVALSLDVIVTASDNGTRAVKAATSTIPIVSCCTADPVGTGLVASLARPGGNLTGVGGASASGIDSKRLQLLKEAVPAISRVAVLYHDAGPQIEILSALQTTAATLDLRIVPIAVSTADDVDTALAATLTSRPDALFVGSSNPLNLRRPTIVRFAVENGLPSSFRGRAFAVDGGLMSYDADGGQQMRRVAAFVDKILRGAEPGDLPMEMPSRFSLVVNRTAAEQLGLSIPPSLAAQVSEWIR